MSANGTKGSLTVPKRDGAWLARRRLDRFTRLPALVWGVSVLMLGVGVVALGVMHLNAVAVDMSVRRVSAWLADQRAAAAAIAVDFSWWDQAIGRIFQAPLDRAWFDDEFGSYAATQFGASVLMIADEEGRVIHAFVDGAPAEPAALGTDPEALGQVIADARQSPQDAVEAVTGIMVLDGPTDSQVYLAAASPFTGEDDAQPVWPPDRRPVLFILQAIDRGFLDRLAERTLVSAPALLPPGQAPPESAVPLRDPMGRTVAHLRWSVARPGTEMLARVGIPLVALFAIFVLTGWLMLRRAGRVIRDVSAVADDLADVNHRLAASETTALAARDAATEALQARDAMVQQLAAVNRDLMAARHQAEAANTAKSRFLASMSHELRTPLNCIIGFAEMMLSGIGGPIGNDRYRGYLTDIRDSGTHLLALLNGILDLSKIEAGKQEIAPAWTGLPAALEQAGRLFDEEARRKGCALAVERETAPARVFADEQALTQILFNLIGNALKFTDPGGSITVSARAAAPDGTPGVDIAVSDTGCGIAEASQELVWAAFHQSADGAGRTAGGTGLGLPLVRGLARLHGGDARLASRPGEGTTVTVFLPDGPADDGDPPPT